MRNAMATKVFLLRQRLRGEYKIDESRASREIMIGWSGAPELLSASGDDFKKILHQRYANEGFSKGKIEKGAANMRRFILDMKKGDIVLVPSEEGIYPAEIK